jgi:hypothetical protein
MEQAVAYVRVSSKAQGLAMQKAAIEKAAERARRRDRPLVLRQAERRHHGPAGLEKLRADPRLRLPEGAARVFKRGRRRVRPWELDGGG